MTKNWQLPRRTFLRGLGTAIALPMLESMMPGVSKAAGAIEPATALPKRMAFIYVPNGANMDDWTPSTLGSDYELPMILQPLKPVQEDLLVMSGLAHSKAWPNGDGAGDHARASATFLTGCQARKTQGADIRVGVSVDQFAAARVGKQTRFASLELGCDRGKQVGNCDSGYSCAYSFNVSWKSDSTPMPPEVDPRQVFDRLFGSGTHNEMIRNKELREKYQKSVLDFVLEDARRLKSNLGYTDRRKLDEYMTAVRELEQRLDKAREYGSVVPEYAKPTGIPRDYEQHVHLMYDLLTLALQTDQTRIATFIMAHDGSNRNYPSIGISDGHHDLSHHGNDEAKKQKIAKINQFHVSQFAYFLQKLKSVREGEGTLLDNCMIVYGSGIGDGNRHNHDELPVLFAGKGGGTIQTGRHIRYAKNTPMTNLYLSMLERVGAPAQRIGDSSGPLNNLA